MTGDSNQRSKSRHIVSDWYFDHTGQLTKPMPRRPAGFTQADIARAIRAAKQAGAVSLQMRPDGTIVVLLKVPPTPP
jgi:hypothetical protein